ncbi:rho GTPase-activating protein 28 [Genypterus blacodes]|uniref:rho GTPase-activating protein 28 n=1 Tax=Genypterus blacodes TaxID=154954 RepID=UPI003F75EE29
MTSDPRHVSMETYWREVRSIEEEKEEEEEEEEEERNSVDEAEQEEAWLTEAGLSSLVTGSPSGEGLTPAEALLSTLTRQQTATVKKRLENYNETLRKRNKQPIRDVRDVFTTDNDSANRSPSPPSQCADSAASSRYHTTTKTIRRNTARVRPTCPNLFLVDQLPEHPPSPTDTHSPAHRHSPTHTHSVSVSRTRQADWLVRESPYSEGVADHKQGGTCWDCLCFHGDDSDLMYVPVSPGPGLTLVDDLSSADVIRLGFISHIELSTFLSGLGIQTKRTPPTRRRRQGGRVFAVPLTVLLETDRKKCPGVKVPVIFAKLLCILEQTGLQTEGILRVPGSAAKLKYLRAELDKCSGGFDWSAVRQVDAAGLLKLFIRELPTPLLTHTHLSTYRAVLGISSTVHQVQALQLLLLLLPEVNRDTLKALLVFLRKVVCHQDKNRMSLWNVSMVMAPNLFTCHPRGSKRSAARQQEEMEEAVGGAHLVRLMITHQDLLWTVPSFLLSQVRQMNQASSWKQLGLLKTKRLLLRRKNDQNQTFLCVCVQVTELCDGVIRVHAPLHTKVSMAIQLDGQTRAKDVTARFEYENSPAQRLYEVGGNIGERRLHPDCVLLEVYRANPHCDWMLKP